MRTRRREQKVRQIALDVLFLVADLDPLAAGADEVFQRGIQIHLMAHLVKVGHLQIAAQANLAAVRSQLAQNHLQQRCLACAVGAQQADLVATQNGAAELLDDLLVAKGLADIGQLGHDLALIAVALAGCDIHVHAAQHITALGTAGTQFLQTADAALAAGAAGFHALANPDLFLGQQLVRLGVDDGLLAELLFLLQHVLRKVARVGAQNAPIQAPTMRVAMRSRKLRSWVIVITLPLKAISSSSSHSMESRSRWLVGSSSNRTSGRATRAWASATRLRVPPDRLPTRAFGSRCRRCNVSSTRCSQFQAS